MAMVDKSSGATHREIQMGDVPGALAIGWVCG